MELATGWLSSWVRIRGKASKHHRHGCSKSSTQVMDGMSLNNLRESSDHKQTFSWKTSRSLISAERPTEWDESNAKVPGACQQQLLNTDGE